MRLASELSPPEKLKVIERLTPDLAQSARLDDQYQHEYEQIPEDVGDVAASLTP